MSSAASTNSPRAAESGSSVVISVDAMGGDRGPAVVVAGMAKSAGKNPDVRFVVHGPQDELNRLIARHKVLADRGGRRDDA